MNKGFYIIMAAQFFSALADNALLIAAIAVLREMQSPSEYEPLLKTFFTVSYVVLAAFVGAFADSMPKWRVMLISNAIKIAGCSLSKAAGADFVKTPYVAGFEAVTAGVYVPVVVLGGARRGNEQAMLADIRAAIAAGGAGVAIGRNIFQAEDPAAMTAAVAGIVH